MQWSARATGATTGTEDLPSRYPKSQMTITRRWRSKAVEAAWRESFWEMSTVVTVVRRRWEGWGNVTVGGSFYRFHYS